MGRIREALGATALLAFVATSVQAAEFVYTNNNLFPANSVSAFSVASNGVLSEITGSPFPTGDSGSGGGNVATDRIVVSPTRKLLFASNSHGSFSGTVSVFSIDPIAGTLTSVPGSPFSLPSGFLGDNSLAVTPNGSFLFASGAGGSNSNIAAFSVAANGVLTPVSGSPFSSGLSYPIGTKVTSDGAFLALADNAGAIGMFSIAASGSLSAVSGSPFPAGNFPQDVEVSCDGRLFAITGTVGVFDVGAGGTLSPVPGSPFPGGGNVAVLSADDRFLFASNVNDTISVLSVAGTGALSPVAGSPFSNGAGATFSPDGLSVDGKGKFLFAANFDGTVGSSVGSFVIGATGSLTPAFGSPTSTGFSSRSGLFSLAAFPGKTCATPSLGTPAPTLRPSGVAGLVLMLTFVGLLSLRRRRSAVSRWQI